MTTARSRGEEKLVVQLTLRWLASMGALATTLALSVDRQMLDVVRFQRLLHVQDGDQKHVWWPGRLCSSLVSEEKELEEIVQELKGSVRILERARSPQTTSIRHLALLLLD